MTVNSDSAILQKQTADSAEGGPLLTLPKPVSRRGCALVTFKQPRGKLRHLGFDPQIQHGDWVDLLESSDTDTDHYQS